MVVPRLKHPSFCLFGGSDNHSVDPEASGAESCCCELSYRRCIRGRSTEGFVSSSSSPDWLISAENPRFDRCPSQIRYLLRPLPSSSASSLACGGVVTGAMAMQSGIGMSKLLILIGAGYTGSIVLRNGKLSDILGDLQALIKGLENSKESSHNDAEPSHLANQLEWLTREVQRMGSSRSITVLNGNSNQGNASSLIVPLASVGAIGYLYLWWKGYSLSDFMYVTKRNMANAVSSMTKHLEQVSSALAAAKRHLTQRIENLDGKVDEQNAKLKEIKHEVIDVNGKLGKIGNDIKSIEAFVASLDGKVDSIEIKQELACHGIWYLCQFVQDKGGKTPEFLLNMAKSSTGKRSLGFSDPLSLKGLQQITDSLVPQNELPQSDIDSVDKSKCLRRTASINC